MGLHDHNLPYLEIPQYNLTQLAHSVVITFRIICTSTSLLFSSTVKVKRLGHNWLHTSIYVGTTVKVYIVYSVSPSLYCIGYEAF